MNETKNFADLGLDEITLKSLKIKGFEEPTPIQKKIIPILLKNENDVIGQAQTGTGKTAAFALPIIEKLVSKAGYIQTLILTPTRELAIQVSDEINSLFGKRRLKTIPIYGGQSIEIQLRHLKRGVDIVVGTPGRVIDHIKRRTLKLDKISFMILDEADEMLNMGFIDDVEEILKMTNDYKRVALFSATMPKRIEDLSKKYMKDRVIISVKNEQVTTDLTEQIYFEVQKKDKFESLCRIIDMEIEFYGLVFCRTKVKVDEIATKLTNRGYEAEGLHGDISQHQRERILNKFKQKRTHVLVATDVAARGLDISDLTHVINYSLPQDPEAYVHRIGRTGRAGKKGIAITFVTSSEYRKLSFIKRIAKTDIKKMPIPQIKEILSFKKKKIISEIENIGESEIESVFWNITKKLMEKFEDPKQIIASLLKITYKDSLDESNYNKISNVSRDNSNNLNNHGKTRLFVSLGRKDGYSPRKLVEFIKKNIKLTDREIDDILVLNDFSFVTLPYEFAEQLINILKTAGKDKRPLVSKAKKKKGSGNINKPDFKTRRFSNKRFRK